MDKQSAEQRFLQSFGKRLAELRKQKGLSQEALAVRADLHAVAITYIETGNDFLNSTLFISLHAASVSQWKACLKGCSTTIMIQLGVKQSGDLSARVCTIKK